MSLNFLNPHLFWLLAFAAVPLLLHLFARTKPPVYYVDLVHKPVLGPQAGRPDPRPVKQQAAPVKKTVPAPVVKPNSLPILWMVSECGANFKRLPMAVVRSWATGVPAVKTINQDAVDKVEEHIADAVAKGGKIMTGGKRHALGGTFFEPTIVTGATREMAFSKEETFGPLAPLFRFKTDEEVVEMANDTIFGLASYFYANDLSRVYKVAEALVQGMALRIEGGVVELAATRTFCCRDCGQQWQLPFGTGRPKSCPACDSTQFFRHDKTSRKKRPRSQ